MEENGSGEQDFINPELPEAPGQQPAKPNQDRFVGYLGVLAGAFITLFISNVISLGWIWSLSIYVVLASAVTWTLLKHAMPHRSRGSKCLAVLGILILLAAAAACAVVRQYKADHPETPRVEIYFQNILGLPFEYATNANDRYYCLTVRNPTDVSIESLYARVQIPEPILTTVATSAPPGTSISWRPILTQVTVIGTGSKSFIGPHSIVTHPFPPSFLFLGGAAQLTAYTDGSDLTGVWRLDIDRLPAHKSLALSFITRNEGDATNYITLTQYQFKTNGATISVAGQGDGNGGFKIKNMMMTLIVDTNKTAVPGRIWQLGTNDLRFYMDGVYDFKIGDSDRSQYFLAPFSCDPTNRTVTALPVQDGDGHWKRVTIEYQ